VNFLRIKQAQCALADGRLDEAHDLLGQESVRSHRHGQRLTTKLVKAYVKRGQAHMDAGRLHEALIDCEKAGTLGGHNADVAGLRQRVVEQMDGKRREADRHDLALGAARQHANEGFLSQGVAFLRGVSGDSARVMQAEQEIELHRTKAEAAIERGAAALDREDWAAAGHHLAEARRLRPYDRQVEELSGRLSQQAASRVREALQHGRIDSAESLLRVVAPATGDDLAVRELREAVGLVAKASAAMEQSDARTASRQLRKVKTLLPDAGWVDEAIGLADSIVASRDALAGGPLGLISDGYASATRGVPSLRNHDSIESRPTTPIAYNEGVGHDLVCGSQGLLPKQFLIQVDGCGSSLVTGSATVSIGPVSSSDRPDVGLVTDPGAPTVTFQRVEDDYFLRSPREVRVNGKPTRDSLLNDGDKIELSPRCRFKFRMPHAASTSAVIELTGARMVRGDVKRIILMDRQIVMGAGPACQVRADSADEPIILCARDGKLVCQSRQLVKVGDEPCDPSLGVPVDKPVCVGPVTFRITQA
jgi:tetratricopeptide (TPR) repeat protein